MSVFHGNKTKSNRIVTDNVIPGRQINEQENVINFHNMRLPQTTVHKPSRGCSSINLRKNISSMKEVMCECMCVVRVEFA